ncbi:MAG: hypothetical protein ACO1N0_15915 [Fluviicola sp.]
MRTETIYGYQSGFVWFYGLYILLAILATLTLKKTVVHIINPLLLIAALFTHLLNTLAFNWWGASPWHPDFRFGYNLCMLSVPIAVLISYLSLRTFSNIRIAGWIKGSALTLTLLIPIMAAGIFFFNQHTAAMAPRMVGEGYNVKNGTAFRNEWWDWPEKNILYYKYFSKAESDSTGEYHLDSIRVKFQSENRSITVPSINGKVNLDKLLETNNH